MLKKLFLLFLTIVTFSLLRSLSCHALGLSNSLALSEEQADIFSQNNITLYNPACKTTGGSSGCCDPTFSSDTDARVRLKELVEQCGEWTMDMQREYGTPWEAAFLHVYDESGVGTAGGVGGHTWEKCHKYNWMGYKYSDNALYGIPESEMGSCKIYHSDGGFGSQYDTVGDMFGAYYTDYTRNGAYDVAYQYTDPKNYDLEKFLEAESNIYAGAGWAAYGAVWRSTVKDIIDEVIKEKNWPTSAELAKKENIKIGGKWEVSGDIKKQMNKSPHSLHACDGSSSNKSSGKTKYSTSSANSCSTFQGDYPQYFQSDFKKSDHTANVDDWTDDPYGPGETVSTAGCGACSMAMLATVAAGEDIYPQDIIKLLGDKYYYQNSPLVLDPIVGEKYGFTVETVEGLKTKTEVYDQMKKYLNDGYMIHFSGEGCHDGFGCSDVGHYVGIFSIDKDDKVQVANSGQVGNSETDLQNMVDAFHHGHFVAIKGTGNRKSCPTCDSGSGSSVDGRDNSEKILSAVEEIIELANKQGSTYTWGGGHFTSAGQYDTLLKGAINVDCTGFASLVMYKVFGEELSFSSVSIFSHPSYEEIDKKDARPGDIFAYNSPSGHGGIVIEVENGLVTKIAETGGPEGRSGGNTNIGYSGPSSFSIQNINSENGHILRYKESK